MSKTLQYMTSIPHRPREMRSNTVTQLSDQANWLWNYVYVRVIRLHFFFHNARVTPFKHFSHPYIYELHTTQKVCMCAHLLPHVASFSCIRNDGICCTQTHTNPRCGLHLMLYVVSYSQTSCQMCVWASYGSFWQRITRTRRRLTQIQPLTSAPVRCRRMLCIIHTLTQKTFSSAHRLQRIMSKSSRR